METRTTTRHRFSFEFKAEAEQRVVQGNSQIAEVARELEVDEVTLGNWVKSYQNSNSSSSKFKVNFPCKDELEHQYELLSEENKLLKRELLAIDKKTPAGVKFALMYQEKDNYTVDLMTDALGVSRAGYYAWIKRGDSVPPSASRREVLKEQILLVHAQKGQDYGYRRMVLEFKRNGHFASLCLVRKLMRELGVSGLQGAVAKDAYMPGSDGQSSNHLICG